jgi:hypothetical protein
MTMAKAITAWTVLFLLVHSEEAWDRPSGKSTPRLPLRDRDQGWYGTVYSLRCLERVYWVGMPNPRDSSFG